MLQEYMAACLNTRPSDGKTYSWGHRRGGNVVSRLDGRYNM